MYFRISIYLFIFLNTFLYASTHNPTSSDELPESLLEDIKATRLQEQKNDEVKYLIRINPNLAQPTFAIPFLPAIKLNFNPDTPGKAVAQIRGGTLPARYQFGGGAQVSFQLPTKHYIDLNYNFIRVAANGSNGVSDSEFTLVNGGGIGSYFAQASLTGQYHTAELFFTTKVSLFNLLDKYFHNTFSIGADFQNLNLHYINNLRVHTPIGTASINQKQLYKVFGSGPSVKWHTELDLLPLAYRPHNLSIFAETKFTALFNNFFAKGKFHLNPPPPDVQTTVPVIDLHWRRPTDNFVVTNTDLTLGVLYAYKCFSFDARYKVIFFSSEDFGTGDFLKGILSNFSGNDLIDLFNVFPTNIGFRIFEVGLNWRF